jgi:hypothetical protein
MDGNALGPFQIEYAKDGLKPGKRPMTRGRSEILDPSHKRTDRASDVLRDGCRVKYSGKEQTSEQV